MFNRSITAKSKKIIRGIVLALTLLLTCITVFSCGSSDNITGKWYNENGKCLDIRSDGTYKLENEYGTGKWRSLGEGNFEFSDFYGDTQEAFLKTDENGEYIEFKPKALGKSGKYYKSNQK